MPIPFFKSRSARLLLAAALLSAGCGSSGFDVLRSGGDSPTSPAPILRGAVRLTPDTPVAGAQVRLLTLDGQLLTSSTSDEAGNFSLSVERMPVAFEVQAATPDGVLLRARQENEDNPLVTVDLLTTIVSNWDERNPEQTLRESTTEVRDYLGLPQGDGANTAYDDSIASDFDPDVFLQQAREQGGVQELIDGALDQLATDPAATAVFVSDPSLSDLDLQYLTVMRLNLPGPGATDFGPDSALLAQNAPGLSPTFLIGPVLSLAINWVGSKIGLNRTLNVAREALAALGELRRQIGVLDAHVVQALQAVTEGFYAEAAGRLNSPENAIKTEATTLENLFSSPSYEAQREARRTSDAAIRKLSEQLDLIHTTMVGNSAQFDGGVLSSYLDASQKKAFVKVVRSEELLRQDMFHGMAYLVARERGFVVQGLSTLLERLHQSYRPNLVNESGLAFERHMYRLKVQENQVIKQLEFTGTQAVAATGKTHGDRDWAERTIPLEVLKNLEVYGLESPGFDTTLSEASGTARSEFKVDSTAGIRAGNTIVIDSGDNQETLQVARIEGSVFTTTASKKTHAKGASFKGANGSAFFSPNILYDRDADLIWLLPSANYWSDDKLGLAESGFTGWSTPTGDEMKHLVGHLETHGKASDLHALGFRNFHPLSIWFGISSARYDFNVLDGVYNITNDAAYPENTFRNANMWSQLGVQEYLCQQALVMEPGFALSHLEISHGPYLGAYKTTIAFVYPETSLRLRVNAVCKKPGKPDIRVDVTNRVVWSVASGARRFDPFNGNQITYDRARLRISNAPGTEGKLDVMLLAGENNLTEPRSPEDYEVQAQLGSNTTRLKVNVTAAPAVGSEERFRVPKYVSHIISQSDFIVSGDLPPRFRAFGRFAVKGVDTQALQTTRYAAALSASNYSEDLTTKVRWSVLGGGQVAAINSQANAATGEAELIMDRGKLTTNQLEVTVQAEYLDPRTNQSLGIAQAKVQIRR